MPSRRVSTSSLPTLSPPAAAGVDRVLGAERPVRAHVFIGGRENVLMVADARPAGRWEPAELGVHPVAGGGPDGSMPVYVRRPHDELLRLVLDPEVAGSRLIVVRGEACAGKARAAYEGGGGRLLGGAGGGSPAPGVAGGGGVVFVGGACGGRPRAAYEAVAGRLADWPLEYPPTAAALAA